MTDDVGSEPSGELLVVGGEDLISRTRQAAGSLDADLHVDAATSPKEAYDQLASAGPVEGSRLVLLDIRGDREPMPELVRLIQNDPATLWAPIVAVCDPQMPGTAARAYKMHVNACIPIAQDGETEEDLEACLRFWFNVATIAEDVV